MAWGVALKFSAPQLRVFTKSPRTPGCHTRVPQRARSEHLQQLPGWRPGNLGKATNMGVEPSSFRLKWEWCCQLSLFSTREWWFYKRKLDLHKTWDLTNSLPSQENWADARCLNFTSPGHLISSDYLNKMLEIPKYDALVGKPVWDRCKNPVKKIARLAEAQIVSWVQVDCFMGPSLWTTNWCQFGFTQKFQQIRMCP